jgi:Rad52/22 family double-strand break repair protein
MLSPRPTAFSASMPGIEEPSQPPACGAAKAGRLTQQPTLSVRAGDSVIVREGSGTGEGRASTPGQAHELALKGAETDATKRALATFGNPFGLALYEREQAGVRKDARCV